jgi:hypothetical protein
MDPFFCESLPIGSSTARHREALALIVFEFHKEDRPLRLPSNPEWAAEVMPPA